MTHDNMTATEVKFRIQEFAVRPEISALMERQRDRVREIISGANAAIEKKLLEFIVVDLCGPMGRWPE